MFRTATWPPRAALAGTLLGLGLWAASAGRVPPARAQVPAEPKAGAVAPAGALFNPGRADDENAIRALDEAFMKAFNAADLDALVATFAADAQVVDERGEAVNGRKAIRERFAAAHANHPGATLATELKSLRFFGPDTAVGRGLAELRHADEGAGRESAPFTVVYVKRGGNWFQGSVEDHNPAPPPEPESNADRLKEITWMLGEWVNESADAVVHTSARWDEGKNFILQDYTLRRGGKPVLKGTMRVGWDPVRKQLRSWVFDTDGGFGEAFWSRDADGRWLIRGAGHRRNGETVETTRVITPLEPHRIRWESGDRSINGQALADGDSFIMVRKPPAPSPLPAGRATPDTPKAVPNPR